MHIHVLGICGTFMAGLAQLARELGHRVTGSDANVYPPMSTQLAAADIEVMDGYLADHLQPAPDQVVIGNALTRGNPAVEYLLNSQLAYTSGPDWLARQVLVGRWVLAVAGTHGKTSTSAMLAWILHHAGLEPGFLIGGVPVNFSQSARLGSAPFFVVEADEYDSAFFDKRSKFVHYRPRTVVLNNLEYDHADIFPDLAAIQRQFHHLVRTIPGDGLIVSNGSEAALDTVLEMGCWTPVEQFAGGQWETRLLAADGSAFEVLLQQQAVARVEWGQAGEHNVHNALAAIAAARHAGVPVAASVAALAAFDGVKRRLELRGEAAGVRIYDDFAHHPTAVQLTLQTLRASGDQGRLIALLELRSNTMRSGVFNDRLADALALADRSFVCARGELEFAPPKNGVVCRSADAVLAAVAEIATRGDRVVIMSNGGFDGIHQRLLDLLASKVADP